MPNSSTFSITIWDGKEIHSKVDTMQHVLNLSSARDNYGKIG